MKRPTAEDRTLADVFRKIQPGRYNLVVEINRNLSSLAFLKCEGAVSITLPDGKLIDIIPCK